MLLGTGGTTDFFGIGGCSLLVLAGGGASLYLGGVIELGGF